MSKDAYHKLLDEAMGINTEIARLPLISEDIMLISYNAEAAAARAGDEGRSLHVLTAEIHQLAGVVAECVHHMTGQVMYYTRNMAHVAGNHTRQQFYNRAHRLMSEEEGAAPATRDQLRDSAEGLSAANRALLDAVPDFLAALSKDVEGIRRKIRLGEIISTNVSIEVAGMMTGAQEVKVFKLLAEKLLASCREMRDIIGLCEKRLDVIHLTWKGIGT